MPPPISVISRDDDEEQLSHDSIGDFLYCGWGGSRFRQRLLDREVESGVFPDVRRTNDSGVLPPTSTTSDEDGAEATVISRTESRQHLELSDEGNNEMT